MKLLRRTVLHLATGAAALAAFSDMALALDYPTRPVHIIVGYAAGGPTDILARLIGQWLSERLGQPFFIEDRPSAATNPATEAGAPPPPRRVPPPCARATQTGHPAAPPQSQFQFYSRRRDGGRPHPFAAGPGSESSCPGQFGPRAYCLYQGPSGQDQPRLLWYRHHLSRRRYTVQDGGRHRNDACALSRLGAFGHRSALRAGAVSLR